MSERSFELVEAPGEDNTPRCSEAAQHAADVLLSNQAVQDWRHHHAEGSEEQAASVHSPVPSSTGGASGLSDAILADLFATTSVASATPPPPATAAEPLSPLAGLAHLAPIHTTKHSSYPGGPSTAQPDHSPSSGRASSAPATRRSFLNDDASRAHAHARVRELAEAVGFDLLSLDINPMRAFSPSGAARASHSQPATPRHHHDHSTASPAANAQRDAVLGSLVATGDDFDQLGDDEQEASPEERVAQLEEERDCLVDKLLKTTEALHDSETRFLAKSAAAEQVHALLVQLQDLLRRAEGERDRAQRQLLAAAATASATATATATAADQESTSNSNSMPREAVAVQAQDVVALPAVAEEAAHGTSYSGNTGSDISSTDAPAGLAAPKQSHGASSSSASTVHAKPAAPQAEEQVPHQHQLGQQAMAGLGAVRKYISGMAARVRWGDAAVLLSCGALIALLLLTHSATWRAGLQASAREQRIAQLQEQVAALQAQLEAGQGAAAEQPQQRPQAASWHMHHGRMKRHGRHKGGHDMGTCSWAAAKHKAQKGSSSGSEWTPGASESTASSASSSVNGQHVHDSMGGTNSTSGTTELPPTAQSAADIEASQKRLEQRMAAMEAQLQAWAQAQQNTTGSAAGAHASNGQARAQLIEQHTHHHHTHHHVHHQTCQHTQESKQAAGSATANSTVGGMAAALDENDAPAAAAAVRAMKDAAREVAAWAQQTGKAVYAAMATQGPPAAAAAAHAVDPFAAPADMQHSDAEQAAAPSARNGNADANSGRDTHHKPASAAAYATAIQSKAALDAVWAKMKEHAAALHQPDAAHMRVVKALRDEWQAALKQGAATAAQLSDGSKGAFGADAAPGRGWAAARQAAAAAAGVKRLHLKLQQQQQQQKAADSQVAAPVVAHARNTPPVHEPQGQHATAQPAYMHPALLPLPAVSTPSGITTSAPSSAASSPHSPCNDSSNLAPSPWRRHALITAQHQLLSALFRLADAALSYRQHTLASPIAKACALLSSDKSHLSWRAAKQVQRMEGLLGNICLGTVPHHKAALAAALSELHNPLQDMLAALTGEANMTALRSALGALHQELRYPHSNLSQALPRIMPGQDATWQSMRRTLKRTAKALNAAGLSHALRHASRQVWEGVDADGHDARRAVQRVWDAKNRAGQAIETVSRGLEDILQAEAAAEVLTAARAKGGVAAAGMCTDPGVCGGSKSARARRADYVAAGVPSVKAVFSVDSKEVVQLQRSYKEVMEKLRRMG